MDFSFVTKWMNYLETERAMDLLGSLNIGDLIYHPWFLGALALISLIAIYFRRYAFLAALLALAGFAALVDHTLGRGTAVDGIMSETLLIFVGGGLVLIFIVIYFLFIRHD